MGEKRIIKEILRPLCGSPPDGLGIGDDAAMLEMPPGTSLLLTTDKIPEDLLALQLGVMDAFHHGRYLATVNISDIAAMGGAPIGLLTTLALPNDFKIDYLIEFFRGVVAGGAVWNTPLVGGDLGWGSVPCLSATAAGYVKRAEVLRRNTARPENTVFVTGYVGGFSTALAYFFGAKPEGLKLSRADEDYLTQKLIAPQARVDIGRLLAASHLCTSCMDITDGVGQTIYELAAESNCGFLIDERRVPLHATTRAVAEFLNIDAMDLTMGIGLDLELLGTLACAADALPESLQTRLHCIGSVSTEPNNMLIRLSGQKTTLPVKGWQHFVATSARELVSSHYRKRLSRDAP